MKRLMKAGKFVASVPTSGWFTLPNGDVMSSPPDIGWENSDGYSVEEVPEIVQDPAIVLENARAAAVEELVAEEERKRLDGIRGPLGVEFQKAKNGKEVEDKLTEMKASKNT